MALRISPAVGRAALAFAAGLTVAVTTLSGGGFDGSSRSMFVALAGGALILAMAASGDAVAKALRSPVAIVLLALAALSVASVAWTLAAATDTLRWSFVLAGYWAMFLVGAALASHVGVSRVAAVLAVLAVLEAALGLRAVALHILPDAERLVRTWRPGGTFEYAPALALIEVTALPTLAFLGAHHHRRVIAAASAAAAALAGAAVAMSGSRLAIGLAALTAVVMIYRPPHRELRGPAFAILACAALGCAAASSVLGGAVSPSTPGSGTLGLLQLAGVAGAGGLGWLAVRALRSGVRREAMLLSAAAVLAIGMAAAIHLAHRPADTPAPRTELAYTRPGAITTTTTTTGGNTPTSALHGRTHEWLAAIQTWLDRPLLGAGADGYYIASIPHQTVDVSIYAHDLPLELAAELGIGGVLLGLGLYVAGARLVYANRNRPEVWLLAPTVLGFLISNLVDWTWHLAGLGAIWALAAGALSAAPRIAGAAVTQS